MNFNMKRPCANCPFLKDGAIELHEDRLPEIVAGLSSDDFRVFLCHKTLEKEERSACMGALSFMAKAKRGIPVSGRVAISTGALSYEDVAAGFPLVKEIEDL